MTATESPTVQNVCLIQLENVEWRILTSNGEGDARGIRRLIVEERAVVAIFTRDFITEEDPSNASGSTPTQTTV